MATKKKPAPKPEKIKPKVGERYRTRCGSIAVVVGKLNGSADLPLPYPFVAIVRGNRMKGQPDDYTAVTRSGLAYIDGEDDFDFIKRIK